MAPFPFLKLPLLAQKVVISQIDLVTAIEFSMVSEKVARVLQHAKITVDTAEYYFYNDSFCLIINILPGTFFMIEPSLTKYDTTNIWNIREDYLEIIKEIDDYNTKITFKIKRKLDTKKLKLLYKIFKVKNKKDADESKLEVLEKITGHLLKFLKVKHFKVYIRTRVDIFNLFIWKYIPRIDTIAITGQYILQVTPDELKLLLENLTTDILGLHVKVQNNRNFKYFSQNQEKSEIRKIALFTSDWLEHVSLLNMAQESICCNISTGFSGKANAILKKWISGENEKLEYLYLWTCKNRKKYNQELILMGINATPSIFTLEECEQRCYVLNSSIIKDIRRDHDGRQATVLINYFGIYLLVWNEKHLKAIGRM